LRGQGFRGTILEANLAALFLVRAAKFHIHDRSNAIHHTDIPAATILTFSMEFCAGIPTVLTPEAFGIIHTHVGHFIHQGI
jgi:hypothetical protein